MYIHTYICNQADKMVTWSATMAWVKSQCLSRCCAVLYFASGETWGGPPGAGETAEGTESRGVCGGRAETSVSDRRPCKQSGPEEDQQVLAYS